MRVMVLIQGDQLLLFAAAAVLTSLLVGVVVATVALVHARRART